MAWTELFSDDFTGSNGTSLPSHDAAWTNRFGTGEIQSNQAADGNGGSGSRSEINLTTEDDQAIEAVVLDTGGTVHLIVRHAHTGASDQGFSGYAFTMAGGFLGQLDRYDSGTPTTLDSDFVFPLYEVGDTVRVEVEGADIVCKVNGSTVLSATDATYSSGKCAILGYVTSGFFDDLVVEHVAAAVANVSLAGTLPSLAGALELDAIAALQLAGTLPSLAAASQLQVIAALQLAGTLPSLAGALELDAIAGAQLASYFYPVRGLGNQVAQARRAGGGYPSARRAGGGFIPLRGEN